MSKWLPCQIKLTKNTYKSVDLGLTYGLEGEGRNWSRGCNQSSNPIWVRSRKISN